MKTEIPKVSIKKGREWHISRGHPWLFSGGISQAPKKVEPGDLVSLLDYEGRFVASGYYNPNCDIAVRVLSREQGQKIDTVFLAQRLRSAWELRQSVLDLNATNVFRLVNAEGDMLPGFIVDYFDGVVVVQCHTAGADLLLTQFVDAIVDVVKPKAVVIRNDASVRHREGLTAEAPRIAFGSIESEIVVKENGHAFAVDPLEGQKTGYFTDQRDKRLAFANYARNLPDGAKVLNGFSYTGSFSIYALAANSKLFTVNVDQSASALEQGKRNYTLNGMDPNEHEFVENDAFAYMDRQIALNNRFEMVLLDPPAFAKTHKDKHKAIKGYQRLNGMGMRLTKPGGILVLCSCSGAVTLDEFTECIRESAGASGRSAQILEIFQHGNGHPLNIMAPEGAYLKVVFCRILDA